MERLVCHPRLPLAAGLDSERPMVRVWAWGDGNLRDRGTVGAGSQPYGDDVGWKRLIRTPSVVWHPFEPLLLVDLEGDVIRWDEGEVSELSSASYRYLAFSPDGESVWAAPAAAGGDFGDSSDILSQDGNIVGSGPGWDTGIAVHPEGTLVLTLCSNQGSTLGVFARVDRTPSLSKMRVQRRAFVLEADGYRTPIFSADGRHIAIRGNAYGNTVDIFEFPSLERVVATSLGEPTPEYPYPQEWLDEMKSWSNHNLAFGSQPGVLWIGTPDGTVVELNIGEQQATEHTIPGVSRISALSSTATGGLLAASATGSLHLLSASADSVTPQKRLSSAAEFMNSTNDLPDGIDDLWWHLTLTDGQRTWDSEDRETVTDATTTDPGWLQIQAQMNRMRDTGERLATAELVEGQDSPWD